MVDIALGREGSAAGAAELGGAESAPALNISAPALETP